MRGALAAPLFFHDLNTCVGCHACLLACANENGLAAGTSWRRVVTFNDGRAPGLPVFHLSLACNHCLEAPCLRQCPARAIGRDERTGAVLIAEESCVGCRYCSWVCPFDAPQFDPRIGVMRKCTLCHERLLAGAHPACVSLCPTGALRLGELGSDGEPSVVGFEDHGMRPGVRFRALRRRSGGASDLDREEAPRGAAAAAAAPGGRGLSLRSEWSLLAFTSTAIVLVAMIWSSALGGLRPPFLVFLALAAAALAVSLVHLGRPFRALRALANWRSSWLSREVIAYGAFVGAGAGALWLPDAAPLPTVLAAALGVGCLHCVDRVYLAMAQERRAPGDTVAAIGSGLFLAGVFSAAPALAVPAGAARLAGFLLRPGGRSHLFAACRVGLGFLVPLVLWPGDASHRLWPAALGAVLGEVLDRAGFYASLRLASPRSTMLRATSAALARAQP